MDAPRKSTRIRTAPQAGRAHAQAGPEGQGIELARLYYVLEHACSSAAGFSADRPVALTR